MPNFDFSNLSGFIYKKGCFDKNNELEKKHINADKQPKYSPSLTLMNTGNYVINKYLVDNLNLANEGNNISLSSSCDVVYFNTLLFEQLDMNLHVVPNLEYEHIVHKGSIYLQTHHMFRKFAEESYKRYAKLK